MAAAAWVVAGRCVSPAHHRSDGRCLGIFSDGPSNVTVGIRSVLDRRRAEAADFTESILSNFWLDRSTLTKYLPQILIFITAQMTIIQSTNKLPRKTF